MSFLERDLRFDAKIIIVRELGSDSVWDGKIKNLVYNSTSMEWEAQTPGGGGGGGGTLDADTSSISIRSLALKTIVDEFSPTVTYVGEASTGTSTSSSQWRIKRLTQTASILTIEWADGDGQFNNVWNDREILTYN